MSQHQNFEEQMQGMKTQLIQLGTLLRLLDPTFWNYLGIWCGCWRLELLLFGRTHCWFLSPPEVQESGYLYFCFRWLLIRFKREFSFQDVLRLWEVSVVLKRF